MSLAARNLRRATSPTATVDADRSPAARETDTERLARLEAMTRTGQLAAAELELHDWQRHDDCPTPARLLLAACLARRGAENDALQILHRALQHDSHDPRLLQLYVAVLIAADLTETARRTATRLYHAGGSDPAIRDWLAGIMAPGAAQRGMPSDAVTGQLAIDLLARPTLIDALVDAAKLDPSPQDIALLRHALVSVARDQQDQPARMAQTCAALADLALLAGDADDARRWTHRGLRLAPGLPRLALLLAQLDDDSLLGPTAADVLRDAVREHAGYPDLRLALVRRLIRDGRADEAAAVLAQWQQEQPASPWVRHAARELAA